MNRPTVSQRPYVCVPALRAISTFDVCAFPVGFIWFFPVGLLTPRFFRPHSEWCVNNSSRRRGRVFDYDSISGDVCLSFKHSNAWDPSPFHSLPFVYERYISRLCPWGCSLARRGCAYSCSVEVHCIKHRREVKVLFGEWSYFLSAPLGRIFPPCVSKFPLRSRTSRTVRKKRLSIL